MKICFFLGSPEISGGTHVIFRHALYLHESGEDVTIVTEMPLRSEQIKWFEQARQLKWSTYEKSESKHYDIAIFTWWKTLYQGKSIDADRYVYFVQSIESLFYPAINKPLRQLVDATYTVPLFQITEAVWIKSTLEGQYCQNPVLVPNGIDKLLFSVDGKAYEHRKPGIFRVLVEGPIDVQFKNVPRTIELCQEAGVDELWLLTSSKINEYKGIDRVFSQVPLEETPIIYRSCDLIVKLSYVEGMFGPPLEMFHCGGTAIVYDVTGHDEYIKNEYNGIVIKTDDEKGVVSAIARLKKDKVYLDKLKTNAIKTSEEWISWEGSSGRFHEALQTFYRSPKSIARERLKTICTCFWDCYVVAEDYRLSLESQGCEEMDAYSHVEYVANRFGLRYTLIRCIKLIIKQKFPIIYKAMYRLKKFTNSVEH